MLNKEKFNEDIHVLDNMFNKYSIATIENDIQTCRQNISDFNVKLMFVGGFSAGKSALINTILGRDLLAEGQLPQTAIATELKYSDREYAELFKDNVCTKINLNEIEQYDPDKYDYVVCHINNEKLKMFKDFVFVDMPGFNSGIERHNKAILRYAGKGNAYVLVIDSDDGEIKGSISDFISEIKNYDNNLAIAISKCDKRTESEISEIADKIQETAQNLFFNEVNIAKVSKMNPEETTAEMVEVINNFDTQSIFNQTVAVDVVSMIDKCLSALKIKKSGLQLDNDEIEKAINAKKQAKEKLEHKLQTETGRLNNKMDNSRMEIYQNVQNALNSNLNDLAVAAQSGGDVFNSKVNSIIRPILMTSIQGAVEQNYSEFINELDINSMMGNTIDFDNINVVNDSLNNIKENMEGMDKGKFGTVFKSIASVLAIVTNFVSPILELAVVFLPDIFKIFGAFGNSEEKKLEQIRNKIHIEAIPQIMSKLEPEIRKELDNIQNEIMIQIENNIKELLDVETEALEKLVQDRNEKQNTYDNEMQEIANDIKTVEDIRRKYIA